MSIEPKYPKVLQQKLVKNREMTSSTKNICCGGGFYESKSPDKFAENVSPKQNKLTKFMNDITNSPNPLRKQMKSVENITLQISPKNKSHLHPERVNQVPSKIKQIQTQIEVQNRRAFERGEKERFYLQTQIEDLQRKVVNLESENSLLKQKEHHFQKFKVENARLIQMYNNKFNEAQTLKKHLNYLHQTVTKPQITETITFKETDNPYLMQKAKQQTPSKVVLSSQNKEEIKTCSSKYFKEFSLGNCSKITQKNSDVQKMQSSMKYSSSGSQGDVHCQQIPETNLEDEMKKLRSVYEKSSSKTNLSSEVGLKLSEKNAEFTNRIESQIQQIRLDGIFVSVEDIQDESVHSEVIKRLGDYIDTEEQQKLTF